MLNVNKKRLTTKQTNNTKPVTKHIEKRFTQSNLSTY